LPNICYKERTIEQSSTTRITATLRTQSYTTRPARITTAIYIIAARYKQATSPRYKASVDSNSLIVKRTSAETTSRTNKLRTTSQAIQANKLLSETLCLTNVARTNTSKHV
jgi:hypothetical protein